MQTGEYEPRADFPAREPMPAARTPVGSSRSRALIARARDDLAVRATVDRVSIALAASVHARDCAAAMIDPTLSGAKNSAGEIVPAFIRTKSSIAFWLPAIAPNSCWTWGGGGSS